MYMASLYCSIKPRSKLAISIQVCCMVGISYMLYQVLLIEYWVACIFLLCLSYSIFMRTLPRLSSIAMLDESIWTFEFDNRSVSHLENIYVLDHYLYFVIYSNASKATYIIWRDQLSYENFKKLKIVSKLYQGSNSYDLNDMK